MEFAGENLVIRNHSPGHWEIMRCDVTPSNSKTILENLSAFVELQLKVMKASKLIKWSNKTSYDIQQKINVITIYLAIIYFIYIWLYVSFQCHIAP